MGTPGMRTPGMRTPGNEDPAVPIANSNSMRNSCKQPYIMKCQFTYAIGQNWSGKQLWMHTGTFNKIPFIPLLIHSDARMVSYSTRFEQSWTTNSRFFSDVCTIFNFFQISLNIRSYKFKFPMHFASLETQAIVFWAWMNCKVQFQYPIWKPERIWVQISHCGTYAAFWQGFGNVV